MNNEKKSIDGLVSRSAKPVAKRTVGLPDKPVKKVISKKSTPKNTTSQVVKSRKKAADDFLKPVSAFDLDLTSEDIKGRKKKKSKKGKKGWKNWSKKKKIVVTICSIFGALLIVALIWLGILIAKMTNGNSNLFDAIDMIWSDVPLKTDENGRTNILAFGTSGYDMEGSEGNGTHDGAQLTDSIMVISLDQETKDVAMVNLPRDLKVSGACSAGKINEIYWCNNKDGDDDKAGAEALSDTMKEVLGVDIQYYMHVDWGSLVQIVDSIGGITVTLDEDINDYWTNTHIDAGVPTLLDGGQSLGLARARHGTQGGDFSRGNSQQKILSAIAQKLKDNQIGITEALGLVDVLGDNLRTDFNPDEIKTIVNLLKNTDINTIRQVPLVDYENNIYYVKTATIGGISYVVPSAGPNDYSEIKEYIRKMFSSDPVVREGANIMILNGSSQIGVASEEKTKLEEKGYTVGYTGDTDNEYQDYLLYVLNESMTGTKAALESYYGVQAQSADQLPEVIYADGYDFIIIVGNTVSEEE